VEITAFVYRPAELGVAPGDTVVFTNRDPVPHTATAGDGLWDSGSIAKDASWRLVVPENGIGAYKCAFHPNMAASLTRGE
jgi:plastocyanin